MHTKKCSIIAASSLAAAMCFLLGLSTMSGCERSSATKSASAERAPDASYTTRGEVKMVPSPAKPTSQLVIMHEPIDDFLDPRTGALGMNSMEMPFDLPKNSPLVAGVMEGDKVELTFGVWYVDAPGQAGKKQIDRYAVTNLKRLPAETALKFGRASPALGTTPKP